MAGMDWFRWHHGSVTDPKFQLVARKSGSSVAEVIGVWATLLEAASMADERGHHGVLDFEALDCSLGLDDGKAHQIYTLMTVRGLVDADSQSICAWSKRQPLREREDAGAAERKQAQRERDKNKPPHVTPKNADENHVTPCHAKKSLEEIRGDKSREEGETHTAAPGCSDGEQKSVCVLDAKPAFDGSGDVLPGPASADLSPSEFVPSMATAVCMAIKAAGIGSVNPSHPDIPVLLAQGADIGLFVSAATEAKTKGKGFAYALGIVRGQLESAKTLASESIRSGGPPRKPNAQEVLEASNRSVVEKLLAKEAAHAAQ